MKLTVNCAQCILFLLCWQQQAVIHQAKLRGRRMEDCLEICLIIGWVAETHVQNSNPQPCKQGSLLTRCWSGQVRTRDGTVLTQKKFQPRRHRLRDSAACPVHVTKPLPNHLQPWLSRCACYSQPNIIPTSQVSLFLQHIPRCFWTHLPCPTAVLALIGRSVWSLCQQIPIRGCMILSDQVITWYEIEVKYVQP